MLLIETFSLRVPNVAFGRNLGSHICKATDKCPVVSGLQREIPLCSACELVVIN